MINLDSDGTAEASHVSMLQSGLPAVAQMDLPEGAIDGIKAEDNNVAAASTAERAAEGNCCHEAELNGAAAALSRDVQKADVQRPIAVITAGFTGIQPSTALIRRFKGVPYMPDANSIAFLTNMGFGNDQAVRALKVTQGNIERAANWLLSGL